MRNPVPTSGSRAAVNAAYKVFAESAASSPRDNDAG
jgi:hypothetical protein